MDKALYASGPDRQTAVVVGAAGGIGRALIDLFEADPRFSHIVALSRERPDGWADGEARSWRAVDILDEASLAEGASHCAGHGPVTRIVVATGLLHTPVSGPEKALRDLDPAVLSRLFAVNAVGPALVAKHFLPLMPRDRPSLFAALSARVGSIEDNRLGGWFGYRASKAALNQLIHTAAIEQRRTRPLGICVALHPGTVETRLSAPFYGAASKRDTFSPPVAAAQLMSVMDNLAPADTGGFFAWDGAVIPW